ncbi:MAG TPA: rhomboid family intramembrane serine protease [Sphingomonas sp.]
MRLPPARATFAIGAITALAWGVVAAAGLTDTVAVLAGFIPARLTDTVPMPPGAVPAFLTPLSATLVHAGLAHLGFNLLIFAFCGRLVEASIGPACFVFLYIVGAFAAAGGQYLFDPHSLSPMIGASGAGSAVIGAYALLYGRKSVGAWGPISGRLLQVVWLAVAWIALQALIGLTAFGMPGVPLGGTIAVAAHVGGFLAGLVLARPLLLFRYRSA